MGAVLNKEPRMPTGFNTHSPGSTHTYTYFPNAVMEDGSTDNLDLTVYRPAGIDPSQPLPAIVWCNIGSFSVSPPSTGGESGPWGAGNDTQAAWFTQCGAIFVNLRLPIQQDEPVWPGFATRGASTELSRRIDAIIEYAIVALKFIRSNPDRANWTVEPNWVFFGGASSGGITSMCGIIRHFPANVYVPGMIIVISGFGARNALLGLNYEAHVRTQLGHTESQYTDSMPPMLFIYLGYDDVVDGNPPTAPSLGGLLADRITAKALVDGVSVVEVDPNNPPRESAGNNHFSLHVWEEGTLTTGSTVEEVIYNFKANRLAQVAAHGSGAVLA